MNVGFIGLGKMGRPMVERLLDNGHRVQVYNRSPAVVADLVGLGALRGASIADVGSSCEFVMTALPTIEAVVSVYDELAATASRGQVFADHSTVSINVNRHCAKIIEARGAYFLDAPVSGGPSGASTGTLTVMVGGDQSAFDRMVPIFESFANTIRLCGPTGAGQAVKLVNQLLVGINTVAVAEAVVLGLGLGVNPRIVLEVVSSSFGSSRMLARNLPRFMSRDFEGATPIDLIVKDLGIVHDEARRYGVPILLGGITEQRFLEAQVRGWGDKDVASVVRLSEESAGLGDRLDGEPNHL